MRLATLALGVALGREAGADILQPGVFMVSQDVAYMAASAVYVGGTYASLNSFAGGTGTSLQYLKEDTTIRLGIKYGLMADIKLSSQWDQLNVEQAPYAAYQIRGGLTYLRIGAMKRITSVLGDPQAAFFPNSGFGDLEFFTGAYVPTRTADPFDYYATNYEGVFKMDFGLHHTYYGALVNPETTVAAIYRSQSLPGEIYAQVSLPFHWESSPIEWLRYSQLGPYFTALSTFGGIASTSSQAFLTQFTATGVPPTFNLNTQLLAAGVSFFHPFSYSFFMSVHYTAPLYACNLVQFNELGVTLNYLF